MFDLPPPVPGIELVIATRGMSKGIAQTDSAQILVKPQLQLGQFQLGGQWKNVSSRTADGEGAAFVGLNPQIGKLQLSVLAAYKFQTGARRAPDSDSLELSASAVRKFGRLGARLALVFSPDDLGASGRSWYLEGGPSFELARGTSLSASLGQRRRSGSADYTSFTLGVSHAVSRWHSLDLRVYGTSRTVLGEAYADRAVLSFRTRF